MMRSRSIYYINSQQEKQPVRIPNSLPAKINTYFNSVFYGTNNTVLSRVRNNGGKYSTSGRGNNNDPSDILRDDSSNVISLSKNSGYAKGSGSIYCRTIKKNEKNYSQFFYSWKQNGKKRTKYIPKNLVSQVQQAVDQKRTVVEILKLLGDMKTDPSNNPSNNSNGNISPSKSNLDLLGDMKTNPSNNPSNNSNGNISPSKNSLDLLGDMKTNPSNNSNGNISPSKNSLDLLGDMKINPTNNPSNNSSGNISPSKNSLDLLGDMKTDPSNNPSNNSNGNISPSKNSLDLLGDMKINPTNNPSNNSSGNISPSKNSLDLLGDMKTNPSNNPSNNSSGNISPSKNSLDLLGDMKTNPSNNPSNNSSGNISPSKIRRKKGEGSGYIYWRIVTRNRKPYWQAHYYYEVWSGGDCLIKSSKYIPKRVLPQILKLDEQKAPVNNILAVLKIII